MRTSFPKLSMPGRIGNVQLKNRIIKAPQHTGLANPDGSITSRLIRHYKELAMGGAGMVIVEYSYVDDDAAQASPCQMANYGIDHIAGLSLLAQTIKANGAKSSLQISHAGRQKFLMRHPVKAASPVPWEELYELGCPAPIEITFDEIQQVIKSFGQAALRAKAADFDMVEIHACHGYLISNFLSPHTNKRTDWYGGSLENRMRFLLELVAEIIKQVGPNYPVCARLSGIDYEPDGTTIDETIELSKRLEALGVAVIHMSGGNHHQTIHEVSPMGMPLANNVWAAEAVKKEVKIPVIASGSITNPELAEQILEEGKGDFVALGRPMWADPYWPQKAIEGRAEDIRPCIRCNDGCLARGDHLARTVGCTVNVSNCKEDEFKIIKAETPKKVAIVGGGPAGMEAARVCALRGHKVTLFEKRKLGGVLLEGCIPDFKSDIRPLIDYFATQMEKLPIEIVMKEADAKAITEGGFDAAIVGTGSTPFIPDVPGIKDARVVTGVQVLGGQVETGQKIAVIGAGIVGVEVGIFLAEQGKAVEFYEMTDTTMNGSTPEEKTILNIRMKECKVSFHTDRRLESVTKNELVFVNRFGKHFSAQADTIVLACGLVPERTLSENLSKKEKLEIIEVGDCTAPRKILDAIKDGHIAAKLLN